MFVDPTAKKPYIFHLARLTVVRKADPEIDELGQEETLECRLVGVRQSEGAEIQSAPSSISCLLRGGHGLPPEAQRLAVVASNTVTWLERIWPSVSRAPWRWRAEHAC